MAPANNIHTRSHSLLLLQKLLNLRDGASPLTLLIDSLEQPAKPLLAEFISRAKVAKSKVIWLSFETLRKPRNVDILVKAAGKDLEKVKTELLNHLPVFEPTAQKEKPQQRAVVIIDSLNALGSASPHALAPFLSALLGSPAVSLVAPYHADVPVILPRSWNEYEPHPFTVLCHLATAILRLSSLRQEVARQRARDRSVVEPEWGLREGREGVVVGLCERKSGHGERKEEEEQEDGRLRGVVVDMELRRRSGRTVTEKFVLVPQKRGAGVTAPAAAITTFTPAKVMLLSDHRAFAPVIQGGDGAGGQDGEEAPESTFNLGLTEKQKRDREGIVLPYFDAQTDIGAGEGGRILYEMGREDDFDDEEDEI